ncbi:phosphatase PAP2 family protein [Agrococcus sp. SCSIO52902]|uniref:phosphatase PAP2 family protein n=1 Tax=Agrococcus sp. SCSIO52902 TaxID=2933290 RepID=UPI001FF3A944|nr:phosphatase PAP2 family protein [Agrococcus sp. SCSIO52902]UOW00190.1 phosphatase PAP2 family protein [Agrococcus sp. SCSIO52902]
MPQQLTNALVASARRRRAWAALTALALAVALSAVLRYRESSKPFGFEAEWMERLVTQRSPLLTTASLAFDTLGGGVVATLIVPGVVAGLLLLRRRPWAAGYFLVASILTGLLAVDHGSFPSGHAANAALVATALGLLLRRWWVWAAGAAWTIGMMLSRTYLGAHWLSDTLGGVLVAVGVALGLWELLAARLERERRGRPEPAGAEEAVSARR